MFLYECDVPSNLPAMKLGAYLAHAMPLLSQNTIRDALKNKDVRTDTARLTADAMAPRGAHLRVYTQQEASIPVVFENEDVLVINKPAGISICEDSWGGMTVENVLQKRYPDADLRAVHRLDNRTCGLVIFAKGEAAEEQLFHEFQDRSNIVKEYICDVKGQMRPESAVREAFLVKNAARGNVRIITHGTPGAKAICTEYQLISYRDGISRLRILLHTGRTHQIRAHMAFLGHPVLGDDLYGDRSFNREHDMRLHLCAARLSFTQQINPTSLQGLSFSVDVPF